MESRRSQPSFGASSAPVAPQFGKQVMQGKLTYVSIIFGVLTTLFQFWQKEFPREDAEALVAWAESAWPQIQTGIAMIVAFYGRLRREFR